MAIDGGARDEGDEEKSEEEDGQQAEDEAALVVRGPALQAVPS